jgi:hypothetical protein
MGLILLSLLDAREQESSQLLTAASIVHYAIVYVALFALPIFGSATLRRQLPGWLKAASWGGLISSLVSLCIAAYPVVDVASRTSFAAKICATVVISNMGGVLLYRVGRARATLSGNTLE